MSRPERFPILSFFGVPHVFPKLSYPLINLSGLPYTSENDAIKTCKSSLNPVNSLIYDEEKKKLVNVNH